MNLPSRWPRGKKEKQKKQSKSKRKILVISGGGARGTYALGIMKAMEECDIKSEIDAIYGVSIGSVIGAAWSNGFEAEYIFQILKSISIMDFYGRDILRRSGGFISNKKIKLLINEYLPENFEDLKIPFYAGCVDTNSAKYKLFHKGDLHKIVLGSMSIPGIFPSVTYDKYSLVDGGALNNFPVDLAKQEYPNHEIIGIALNKFQMNQKINSAFDNLIITFEVMMRSKLLENTKLVDYLFYKELPIEIISLNKDSMQKAFELGYKDGIKMFKMTETKR